MDEKMTREQAEYRLFTQGYDCAQAVFAHYAEKYGLDEEDALKIASCFGGGAHCGELCGCVTGALMAIGLAHGFSEENDSIGKQLTERETLEFQRRFKERFGSLLCRDLLGYNVAIPEEKMKIGETGVIPERCPGFVAGACDILDDILD